MLSRAFRAARRAEAAGKFDEAAALYAESGARTEAATALLFHASRQATPRARAEAYTAALGLLDADDPRRDEVEAQVALARVDAATRSGAGDAAERDGLREAARTLTRLGRDADAATAWQLLGADDELEAALERAGEVEKLEQILERRSTRESVELRVAGLLRDHDAAMQGGAREVARQALAGAVALAPGDARLRDMLRRLEARAIGPSRVELRVDRKRVVVVARLPIVLGREADVVVRGATVSRRHAEISASSRDVVVRDLGARNGTLVAGVPLASALALTSAGLVIGLGEDVDVWLVREIGGVRGEVRRGPDRDVSFVVGDGSVTVPGARAALSFAPPAVTLRAEEGTVTTLDGAPCRAPIDLLRGDVVVVDGVRIEVVA